MYISLWENSRGHPDNISFMQFSTKIDGFEQKDAQGFENSYNSYEQYPLEKFFIFTIYQNYTLALIHVVTVRLCSNSILNGDSGKTINWASLQRTSWHKYLDFISAEIDIYQGGGYYRPYAYDVTEGRPRVLGVKRGTVTCAIAMHAAKGPTPACHTAGLARARALTERLSANALCQHNTCAQREKSWPPTWRRCQGDVMSMH